METLSKHIVFALLGGTATPLQKKLIEEWLRHDQNMELFYEWVEEWESLHPQFIPDVEKALADYTDRMNNPGKPTKISASPENTSIKPLFSFPRYWWLAACVLLLLVAGWVFRTPILNKTYATGYGEIQSIVLGDGSRVVLNANSRLQVPRFGFGNRTREVFLQGEAEFSVTHTPDNRRFRVLTPQQMNIEVLGTEFVVYSRSRGSKVALRKGKVKITGPHQTLNTPLTLTPGDVVTMDKTGSIQKKSAQPIQKYSAWKNHRFVFDQTSLQEVAYLLEETFGTHLQIPDPELAQRQVSGTYRAQNAREILLVLSEMMDLKVSEKEQALVLTSNE